MAKLSTTARNAACNAVVDLVDDDDGSPLNAAGAIHIYEGAQPATPQASTAGSTLLVKVPFANPAFGNAGASLPGKASIAGTINATITHSGQAQWYRIVDRDEVAVWDGPIGEGSGGDINFNDVNLITGGTVTITGLSVTQPQN